MPRLKKYLSEMGKKFNRNNYSVEGSPARHYNAFGQIVNSMNPYTATMNASRSTNEYMKNLEVSKDLNRYASYMTAPIVIAAAPVGSEAMFTDALLGNNYAAAVATSTLRPLLGHFQELTTKEINKKKHLYNVEGKHDSIRRHY